MTIVRRQILPLFFLLFATLSIHDSIARTKTERDTGIIYRQYLLANKITNVDSAIAAYKRVEKMAFDINYLEHVGDIYLKLGEKYANKGDYNTALNYMNSAAKHQPSLVQKATVFSHIGWVYFTMGDYVTASENFYVALDHLNRIDKKDNRGCIQYIITYRFLGLINFRLHQNYKAIYFLNMGESMAKEIHNAYFIAMMLFSKGDFYNDIKQPDSALKYYSTAVQVARESGNRIIEAEANAGIGKSLTESGSYKEAIYYLRLALRLDESMDNNSVLETSYHLGDALYHLEKYQEAEQILVANIAQAKKQKSIDNITRGYEILANIYRATGQFKKALDCMDSLSTAKDSLVSVQKTKDVNLLDIKYRTAEKDKQIALQQSKIARKDTWILGISSIIVLLAVISVAVYLNTLHRQRMNEAQLHALEKENKIEVLKAVVLGGDKERTHIARELHDGVGGMVSAAMMRFSALANENEAIPEMASYREAMKILNEVGDEVRKTAHNLMPDALQKQPLPDAVQAFCNSVRANGDLQINFQFVGEFNGLTQAYKLNLYRIIQELIKNVVQHANASKVTVQLLINESVLIVSVEDNGTGFDINKQQEGIGLQNIQTRVSSLDGTFVLDSTPGKGTSAFAEFKLPLDS